MQTIGHQARLPACRQAARRHGNPGWLSEQLEGLHRQHPQAHFHVRIDAAGQYAANLERCLRGLALPMTLSIWVSDAEGGDRWVQGTRSWMMTTQPVSRWFSGRPGTKTGSRAANQPPA